MFDVDSLILALLIATALVAVYLSPLVALKSLQKAADADDTATLETLLDAPSILSHIQQRLTTKIASRRNEDGSPSSMAAHAAGVAVAWAPALLTLSTTPKECGDYFLASIQLLTRRTPSRNWHHK